MTADRSPVELLDALDALRAKATPGPWGTPVAPTWIHRAHAIGHVGTTEHAEDAACIVAEHNAVPALVAALRAALELADEMSDEDLYAVRFFAHQIGAAVAAALGQTE